MKKLLPVVFCGVAAISYSQLTLAGGDAKNSGAGPTDNPNVTRDAQGREHANKGKHAGQAKNKKDKDESAGSGSTSAPDAAKSSDSTSAARSSDYASPSGSSSESATTK